MSVRRHDHLIGPLLLCLAASSAAAAPITFNTALPVARGEFINRELLVLKRADDPGRDLDVNTLRALEDGLENFGGCAGVISHDRWFLDRIATHILAFEGDSQVIWVEGNYSEYEESRRQRRGDEAERAHRVRYGQLRRREGSHL